DGSDAATYQVDDEMLEDEDRARTVLSGTEFIFDVQTHSADPVVEFDESNPPDDAINFIKQIFVQSETTVACITGVPAVRGLGVPAVQANRQLREIMDRLGGPRLVFHANMDPENGPAEL